MICLSKLFNPERITIYANEIIEFEFDFGRQNENYLGKAENVGSTKAERKIKRDRF